LQLSGVFLPTLLDQTRGNLGVFLDGVPLCYSSTDFGHYFPKFKYFVGAIILDVIAVRSSGILRVVLQQRIGLVDYVPAFPVEG
jgi:hypothetical protein